MVIKTKQTYTCNKVHHTWKNLCQVCDAVQSHRLPHQTLK